MTYAATPFTSAIIVAAGKGTRMTSVSDKLMADIRGKTVLLRTIGAFENSSTINEIIIVTRNDLMDYLKKNAELYGFKKITKIVAGGNTRGDSVMNGIKVVSSHCKFLCIHDGARPFIKPGEIDNINTEAYEYGAVCCGTRVKNTIKILDKDGYIVNTPRRDGLFSAATPQVFKKEIYDTAISEFGDKIHDYTDDSGFIEASGTRVKAVECSYRNIKITTDEDLLTAEKLL